MSLTTVTAVGSLVLGIVKFTTDPATYDPYEWPRRHAIYPGVEESVTILDNGVIAKDRELRAGSGPGSLLHIDVVAALMTLYLAKGAVHALVDWLGNDLDVFIREFKPSRGPTPEMLNYTMLMRVSVIRYLFGVSYTGS